MKNTALFKVINETRINLKFRALSQNVTNTKPPLCNKHGSKVQMWRINVFNKIGPSYWAISLRV